MISRFTLETLIICIIYIVGKTGCYTENTVNDSVQLSLEKIDDRKEVGLDVETSLGQQDKQGDDFGTPVRDYSGLKTASKNEVPFGDTTVNSPSEEDKQTEVESDPDECPFVEKDEEDVVDVDDINSEDIPLGKKYGDSVAKRLRSNKGKVISFVMETAKTRTKTAGVGPKKGWSKVKVKSTAGRSRKMKVVSSSEFEYDVEKDVPNIILPTSKKSAR